MRIEDPWEFEHHQMRLGRHERAFVEAWLDEHPGDRLPTKIDVCPQCGGRGRSSLHLGSYTSEELWEDPEFAEEYLSGGYDRVCESCQGRNVVETLDHHQMRPEVRHAYELWMQESYDTDAIERQERMMGA